MKSVGKKIQTIFKKSVGIFFFKHFLVVPFSPIDGSQVGSVLESWFKPVMWAGTNQRRFGKICCLRFEPSHIVRIKKSAINHGK